MLLGAVTRENALLNPYQNDHGRTGVVEAVRLLSGASRMILETVSVLLDAVRMRGHKSNIKAI